MGGLNRLLGGNDHFRWNSQTRGWELSTHSQYLAIFVGQFSRLWPRYKCPARLRMAWNWSLFRGLSECFTNRYSGVLPSLWISTGGCQNAEFLLRRFRRVLSRYFKRPSLHHGARFNRSPCSTKCTLSYYPQFIKMARTLSVVYVRGGMASLSARQSRCMRLNLHGRIFRLTWNWTSASINQ